MKIRILAWGSSEAKQNAGRFSWVYGDRPVAKPHWEKIDDHPVKGLSVYQVQPDPSSASSPSPKNRESSSKNSNEQDEDDQLRLL